LPRLPKPPQGLLLPPVMRHQNCEMQHLRKQPHSTKGLLAA
jgi:hypothetical protein